MDTRIFDTRLMPKHEQFSFWNDWVCDVFTQLRCEKDFKNGQYNGLLTSYDMEQIQVSIVEAGASEVYHSKAHVSRSNDEVYLLHLQLEGKCLSNQNRHSEELQRGDFALCKSSSPYSLIFNEPIKMMVVKIPQAILQKYIPQPELIIGLKVSLEFGFSKLLFECLNQLWTQKDQIEQLSHKNTMSDVVLSLIATTYELAYPNLVSAGQSSVRLHHVERIKSYIRKYLSLPNLTPCLVAQETGVSARYLRMLFSDTGSTCGQYILSERLKSASNELKNPKFNNIKINEVAYKWGFNNQSHFSKSFREYTGYSPRDFRRMNNY